MIVSDWYSKVLDFWFNELTPKQWYVSTPEIDAQITARFKNYVLSLAQDMPEDVKLEPKICLAAIICFDQFTRNIFRGEPEAFSYDHLALELALHYRAQGWASKMDANHNQFAHMPFMHAENMDMQEISLAFFGAQGEESKKAAQDHYDIIAQFGRYPHRNDCLGRDNTEEEIQYLENAQRFGQ